MDGNVVIKDWRSLNVQLLLHIDFVWVGWKTFI